MLEQTFFENPSLSLLLLLRSSVISIGISSDGLFLVFLGDLEAGVETWRGAGAEAWCGTDGLVFVSEAGFFGDFAFWHSVGSFVVGTGTDAIGS